MRKKPVLTAVIIVIVLAAVWIIGRYGWHIAGFDACDDVAVESVTVNRDENGSSVHITGRNAAFMPKGCIGCHTKQEGDILYVGFRFSGLFGIFETARIDTQIPAEGEISQVYIKTKYDETLIWDENSSYADDDLQANLTYTPDMGNVYMTINKDGEIIMGKEE